MEQKINSRIKYEVSRYRSEELKSNFFHLWEDLNEFVGPIGFKTTERYSGFYTDSSCSDIFCYIDFQNGGIKLGVDEYYITHVHAEECFREEYPAWSGSKKLVGKTLYSFSQMPEITAVLSCCCQMRRGIYKEHDYLSGANKVNIERVVSADLEALYTEERIEGEVKIGLHTYYERDPKLRAQAVLIHGCTCMACGFNFKKVYGSHGLDFIEVHHIKPISEIQENVTVNPETDMVVVCSNCHSMIHRKRNSILDMIRLKKNIEENRKYKQT